MKTNKTLPIFFFLLTLLSTVIIVHASTSLTVTTDKSEYESGESITVYGTLNEDGSPVSNGLVGIEVRNPTGDLITLRTVDTGSEPSETPYIELSSVIPCNSSGDPVSSFARGNGKLMYFRIIGVTNDIEWRYATIVVCAYAENNIPTEIWRVENYSIAPKENPTDPPKFFTIGPISLPLDNDTPLGEWTYYANAYTDYPQNFVELGIHGTPYCAEVSAPFEITGSGTHPPEIPSVNPPGGNYYADFVISPIAPGGTYHIYTSSRYYGSVAYSTTTFTVTPWYMKADLNDDAKIDSDDLFIFIGAYIEYYDDGIYDINCDYDLDGDLDSDDLFAFVGAYIAYFQT